MQQMFSWKLKKKEEGKCSNDQFKWKPQQKCIRPFQMDTIQVSFFSPIKGNTIWLMRTNFYAITCNFIKFCNKIVTATQIFAKSPTLPNKTVRK